ncbi:MAG: pyridoxal-phosphate dependent enzyme [Phycisphaeraceae bacterium]|nr:pyridoxal-phosphate dependent enzyme [Phycisphaeraceae bacterium]
MAIETGTSPRCETWVFLGFRRAIRVTRRARTDVRNPQTIADGTRTPSLGRHTFPLVLEHVDRFVTVEEDEFLAAMRLAMDWLKLVVEPSGVLGLAGLFRLAHEEPGFVGRPARGARREQLPAPIAGPRSPDSRWQMDIFSIAAQRELVLERQEVKERQLAVAVEIGQRVARGEEVLEGQEVEDGQLAVAVEVGAAGDTKREGPFESLGVLAGFKHDALG